MTLRPRFFATLLSFLLLLSTSPLLAGAGAVITEKIEFRFSGRIFEGELISPRSGHFFNALAENANREIDGLKIVISDELLAAKGGRGAYSIEQHTLFVSTDMANSAQFDTTLRHELLHAKLWLGLRKSQPYIFNGIVYNSSPAVSFRAYGPAFAMDEVVTTLMSLKAHSSALKKAVEAAPMSRLIRSEAVKSAADDSRTYLLRLVTMLGTLSEGFESSRKVTLIETPAEVSAINSSVSWQQITKTNVRAFVPASLTDEKIRSIAQFAVANQALCSRADEVAYGISELENDDKLLASSATLFIQLIDQIFADFGKRFPAEDSLIKGALE